jgi:uncharacterized protein (UPF0548 family)
MFTFRRPTDEDVRALLARQNGQPWSYDWPGITRTDPSHRRGWQIDHHRVLLGHGAETFAAACQALCGWHMFPSEMCQVFWPDCPQEPGEVVAVLYRSQVFRLWMLFPARVVYRVEQSPDHWSGCTTEEATIRGGVAPPSMIPSPRPLVGALYGFAYGTLPEHPEWGEERFLVEWNTADDSVWYDLLAVSRPSHWLARLGYPYARYEQAKFRRLSGLAMQAAVNDLRAFPIRNPEPAIRT